MRPASIIFTGVLLLFTGLQAHAQIPPPQNAEEVLSEAYSGKSYSPYADRGFATIPLWGDTHLHTGNSFDAGAFGARLLPEDAYRFARGEQVTSSTGVPARLSRPLDWLVVADHSDNMGFFPDLYAGKQHIISKPQGREWYNGIKEGRGVEVAGQVRAVAVEAAYELISLFANGEFPDDLAYTPDSAQYKSTWQDTIDAAEQYNEPGRFTAFIGYEWTSLINGNNMHRVVIYRDGADTARQTVPYTTYPPLGSPNPRDLWKWMASYEEKTGGDLLALAHNGNLANGIMFPLKEQFDGKRLDRAYVRGHANQGRW